jgi:hypothetical protein
MVYMSGKGILKCGRQLGIRDWELGKFKKPKGKK